MSKKTLVVLLLLIFIGSLVSCSACSKKGGNGMPPPVVEAQPVKTETWQTEINAIGTLSANQGVVIKPEIAGRVAQIYFRSGENVKAGTPLVQFNSSMIQAELEAAQARLILTKATYDRTKSLYAKNVASELEMDTSLSNYNADIAAVAQNQAHLNQTLIRAPFDGRLGLRLINVGDYINAGDPITNIQDVNPLRIDFNVPEVYLSQLSVGQTVLVNSRAFPDQVFTGKVYAFDSTIDPNTRSLGVRASLPNKDQKLLPGGFVELTLLTGKPQQLITVPETSLIYEADGEYVYKLAGDLATKTKIVTGKSKNNQIAVLSGLKAGDVVVSAGQFKIIGDKAPVMIRK